MRKLLLLPILALALACEEAPNHQADADPLFAPASRQLMVLNAVETFDQPYTGDITVTPSGILHMRNIHNGFVVSGDLEGYNHVYGQAMIDTRTGRGEASGTSLYELTSPGVGTLECTWKSKLYDYPVFLQYAKYTCNGTGYFEGMKVKIYGNNDANPGVGIYAGLVEVR